MAQKLEGFLRWLGLGYRDLLGSVVSLASTWGHFLSIAI